MIVLREAKKRTIVSSFVWTKHRNVTEGQTGRRTDRQTDRQNRSGYYSGLHCEQCRRAVKIHFTYLQQHDENHCVYLARGRHSEKNAGGNVTMHAQHRVIFCIIYASIAN